MKNVPEAAVHTFSLILDKWIPLRGWLSHWCAWQTLFRSNPCINLWRWISFRLGFFADVVIVVVVWIIDLFISFLSGAFRFISNGQQRTFRHRRTVAGRTDKKIKRQRSHRRITIDACYEFGTSKAPMAQRNWTANAKHVAWIRMSIGWWFSRLDFLFIRFEIHSSIPFRSYRFMAK